jgi:hypothetical protein
MITVKDNIHDFIDSWKVYDKQHKSDVDWNVRFKCGGYYSASAGWNMMSAEWNQMHKWCEEHIGKQRYAWTGSTFWFETKADAAFFILRWS